MSKNLKAFVVRDGESKFLGYGVYKGTEVNSGVLCFTADVSRAFIFGSISEAKAGYIDAVRRHLDVEPSKVSVHQLIYHGTSFEERIK